MTQTDPFSKLGALDQQLFSPRPSVPAIPPKAKGKNTPVHQHTSTPIGVSSNTPTYQSTNTPVGVNTTSSSGAVFTLNEVGYRNHSFLFTDAELDSLEDIKIELKRRYDIKVSKNTIIRCALHAFIEEYRQQQLTGAIVSRLKRIKK